MKPGPRPGFIMSDLANQLIGDSVSGGLTTQTQATAMITVMSEIQTL